MHCEYRWQSPSMENRAKVRPVSAGFPHDQEAGELEAMPSKQNYALLTSIASLTRAAVHN